MATGGVTSQLDPKWCQKARDELGEDDKETDSAVETLRTWITQQPWLTSPTDHKFLLRFLRVRKFSQLGAREALTNYWSNRTKNPKWMNPKVHPANPVVLELIKSGFFVYMPGEDSQGRKVIIERPGFIKMADIKEKYGIDVVMQTLLCTLDVLNMDERIQVNGFVWLHDATHTSNDTTQVYNISTFKHAIPLFQKGYPSRIKSLNVYNMPLLFETLLKVFKSMLTEKTGKRLHIHGKTMVSVYKEVEQSSLPREYLPDDYTGPCAGTLQDWIDNMVKDFTNPEVVKHVTDLNSGKYCVNHDLKRETEVPAASFRKLHVE